ncbi:MAG: family 16 glycosylhydrolase [Bacteroidales bacterium]|nr:family 16 glycosylhydrolase [Bacteroidales bacterium]
MRMAVKLIPFLFLALACGGGGKTDPVSGSVSVSPAELSCGQDAQTLTLEVTASGPFQAYAADDVDWVTVDPSYSAQPTALLTVKVKKNDSFKDRETEITIKCGTTREKVPLKQSGGEVDIDVPAGYHLVWRDEFNEGSELNKADWTHEVQGSGWVNNELQNYVNHVSPSGNEVTEINGGSLHIHCFKEGSKVYSGRVYAHVKSGWLYGWFEARIKLPSGKGTWPAFWMMPVGNDWNTNPWPMCGEIDIMEEVGVVPNEVSSSIHTQDYNHTKNTQKTHAMTISKAEGDYHIYALEWTPDAITTYVDGKIQLAVTKAQLGSGHNQWPFHYAFYPIFNLAWGGDWGGMRGVDESALPITMSIDYIRVFQKN